LSEKVNVTYSANLFNKDSEDVLDAYIGLKGYVLASGYKITHPIKVSKGITYKVAHNANLGSEGYCARCEADGTWIKSILMTSSNGYDTITADFDGYMRFSMGTASPDTFMVCIAEQYPSSYIPYRKLIEPSVFVPSANILGGNIGNPLNGKILAVDGDSICEGISNGGGYSKIIAERNNMVVQNLGISGGTLAETFRADGTRRHCISLNVSNLREDADYIILEGGVNDGESIGEVNKRFEGDFDYTTMIGALDTLFASLYARFPGKKIGFIIVHSVNENWSAGGERYEAALAACKKWGIPVCDLSTSCPPFGCMSSDNPLRVTYTTNGDGYHPTDEGYKKYYCDKIEAWMKTL
jgi:lysophospholipase L1-like esterase